MWVVNKNIITRGLLNVDSLIYSDKSTEVETNSIAGTRPTLRKAGRITVRTLWAGSISFGPAGRGPNTSQDPKLIFVFVFLIVEYVPSFSRIYNGGLYTFFICRAGLKFHEIFLKLFDARVW